MADPKSSRSFEASMNQQLGTSRSSHISDSSGEHHPMSPNTKENKQIIKDEIPLILTRAFLDDVY